MSSTSSYLLEAAIESVGVYPAAVHQNGIETPRDRYGDGWNDALHQIYRRHTLLLEWRFKMIPEVRVALDKLFSSEIFNINVDGETVILLLGLNDVFLPAADSKIVQESDIPKLADLYHRFDIDGLYAWASQDYKIPPREGRVNEERYQAALKEIYGP